MSYQSRAEDENDTNGQLGFLKTVVSNGSVTENNGTDSDKENDHRLVTIAEEPSEATRSSVDSSKEQGQGHFNQEDRPRSEFGSSLRSQAMAKDGDDAMWDDFYNDEEFKEKKEPPEPSSVNVALPSGFTTQFEIENGSVPEKVEDDNDVTEEPSQGDDYSSIFDNSVKDGDDVDGGDRVNGGNSSGERKTKRPRKKRLFKRRLPPRIVTTSISTGGSDPNLGPNDNSSLTNHLETMSESGGAGDKGRKLSRRKQVSRPRCAGPTPNGDVLQQKYQELEHLVLKPLPNPAGYVKQTKQQMMRLQGLGNQYHTSNHNHVDAGRPPPPPPHPGNARDDDKDRWNNQVIVEESSDQAYSTIRTLQVVQRDANSSTTLRHNRPRTAHASRRPRSGNRIANRPASAGRERPSSAVHRRRENAADSSPSAVNSQVGRGRGNQKNRVSNGRGGGKSPRGGSNNGRGSFRSDSESKDRSSHESRDSHGSNGSRNVSADSQNRSTSRSPSRIIQNTDTFLKNSSNPSIRDWLKIKNKQQRLQKKEERKKKREEREEKQEVERKKQEYLQGSDKKVKDWMVKKKKEAWKKAKEEKKREHEEEIERFERQEQGQYSGSLRGHSIERPQSAPAHSNRKMFIPIIRPDGDQTTVQCNGEMATPQPPKSKFVYKRPVSGRVRLMKLQQERKEDSKKQEIRKKEMEKLTEDEKNQKMRMSYDQWLLKKRQDDYEKRQKLAKQRALAKSDPELERIIPEVARRRIENIQRGRKPIKTNVDSIDERVNNSFGGGNFGEEQTNSSAENQENTGGLEVSGQKKSLRQRPSSATPPSANSPLNPQMSRSPRRPKSALPRTQTSTDVSEDGGRVVHAKEFQLPFPPELGVPKFVAERQQKLFAAEVFEHASKDGLSNSANSAEEPESNNKQDDSNSGEESQAIIESQITESHDSTTPEDHEMNEVTKTEQSEGDSSFFITNGAIDTESQEVKPEEMLEAEVNCDDSDDPESVSQDTEDPHNNQPADDDINGNEINLDENEEQKIGNQEEETNETPGEEKEIEEKNISPDSIHNEEEESHVLNTNDISTVSQEQQSDHDVASHTHEKKLAVEEFEASAMSTDDANGEMVEEQKEIPDEEEDPKSEVSESRSSTKHVSFVEEATIHEDPLAGISAEDYDNDMDVDYDDDAEDERGDYSELNWNQDEEWEGNNVQEQVEESEDF